MYTMKWHRELTIEKWREFGTSKQILMIANELNRAANFAQRNDEAETTNALERAFELLDLTVSIGIRKNMLRELLRFREILSLQYISKTRSAEDIGSSQKVLLSLNGEAYNLLHDGGHSG